MKKAACFAISGQKKELLALPKEIFNVQKGSSRLLVQAVRVFLANQRKAKAKAKARGEISGSTRKIYRQKGTGQARHGDRYAPIFVGGGVAHGPTGEENYKLSMSKKMKKKALFLSLTAKLENDEVIVLEGLGKVEPKTKEVAKLLEKTTGKAKKILLVLPGKMENVTLAARNIKGITLARADLLNAYQVLNGGQLVLAQEAIEVMKETFLNKKK